MFWVPTTSFYDLRELPPLSWGAPVLPRLVVPVRDCAEKRGGGGRMFWRKKREVVVVEVVVVAYSGCRFNPCAESDPR